MKKVLRRYKRIEGDLMVYFDGRLFIGKIELKYPDETLTLTVKQFKQIISDTVSDTKDGLR